jgi:hypothetical protein
MKPRIFFLAACVLAGTSAGALAYDYPTVDRVLFVDECLRDNPGPHWEMVQKCSCMVDTLARQLSYDDYVSMSTATKANSIGGERGSYIRDVESLQKQIRQFRDMKAQARKACFIGSGSGAPAPATSRSP